MVSWDKTGSTSNYWTNCTLVIATGSATLCDRTNSTVLYCVKQRLRQLAASDTSNVMAEQFLPSVGHHVMWVQACHQNKSHKNILMCKTNSTVDQLCAFRAMLSK